jgi:hypothetical protein
MIGRQALLIERERCAQMLERLRMPILSIGVEAKLPFDVGREILFMRGRRCERRRARLV